MITAAQIKAARALVGITQEDIAKATGLSVQTIKRMETVGTERSTAGNVDAVEKALEAAGVVFQAEGEMISGGPGVRLKSQRNDFEPIGLGVAIDRHEGQIGLAEGLKKKGE